MNLINRIGEELGFALNFVESWIVVNVLFSSNCRFIHVGGRDYEQRKINSRRI